MRLPWVSRSRFEEVATRAISLSDELRVVKAQLEDTRLAASTSALEARNATRMVADWLAEHQFGKAIFNVAPPLASETPNMDLLERFNTGQGRTRARDLVRLGEEQFLKSFREAAVATNPQ